MIIDNDDCGNECWLVVGRNWNIKLRVLHCHIVDISGKV